MYFFTRTNTDDIQICFRRNRSCEVNYFRAGDLRDKDFSAFHLFDAIHHKADALLQREPEACHAIIGDCDCSAGALLEEQWNNGAATPHYISISDARIARGCPSCVGVALNG